MSPDMQIASCAIWLTILLAGAALTDLRSHRIPNALVLCGIMAAFALHALLPAGGGLFDAQSPGALGIMHSVGGMAVGIGVLLPFYLMRAMGAGDAKLMGMVGAFLGPTAVLQAALFTLLAGGVLAIVAALWTRSLARLLDNLRLMLMNRLLQAATGGAAPGLAPEMSAGKLPYALAIATGTALYVALAYSGHRLWT